MSKQDSKPYSITTKLERLELEDSIKVLIPKDVTDKIIVLCQNMKRFEWSGILLYEVIGSMKKVSKLKLVAKDIVLMDRGSSTHTSFNWDEEIVKYKIANPKARSWKMGHIHSHNVMSVFFSPEDWSELNDSCKLHNFYLSVIVNNFLEVTGKVVTPAYVSKVECKDEKGEDYSVDIAGTEEGGLKPIMLVYDCTVQIAKPAVVIEDKFTTRMTTVMTQISNDEKEAAKRKAEYAKSNPPKQIPQYASQYAPGYNRSQYPKSTVPDKEWAGSGWIEDDVDGYRAPKEKKHMTADEILGESFGGYLLRMGTELVEDRIEDAMDEIGDSGINSEYLSRSIISNYDVLYWKYFHDEPRAKGHGFYIRMLSYIIGEIQEQIKTYPTNMWAESIIEGLQEIGMEVQAKIDKAKQQEKEEETWKQS